jgi:hypothetical protein
MNVKPFIGKWFITTTTGPLTQPGEPLASRRLLVIGTGEHGDSLPSFSEDYEVQVGFALLNESGEVLLPKDGPEPLLTLVDHQLRWHGPYEGQELNINIALAEVFREDESDRGRHYYLFGSSVYGDPDQVGIWGASGTPGGGTPKEDS